MNERLPQDVAQRRKNSPHTSMFLRMLFRAAVLRRGRALSALFAMVVAATAATAMLNLYIDVQSKLRREFRNYGANIVVIAKDGQALPSDALQTVNSTLAGHGLAVPFAYVVARTIDGQPVVVSGTDFEQVRKLNRWWSTTSWPVSAQDVLVGTRAQGIVATKNLPFDLSFHEKIIHVSPSGVLTTGAAEDSRIYLSLSDFEKWTGIPPSTIEVAASGSPEEINATIQKLTQALPAAEVRPVRQIMEGEARVLGKMRSTLMASSALIILTAALCVLATLMGWVFDRRRDFAIMRALGASTRLINGFFAAEAAALGAVGAIIGFMLGVTVAAWIGHANFHSPVTPRFNILPVIVVGGIVVALLSAALPISLLRRVQPASILRGE